MNEFDQTQQFNTDQGHGTGPAEVMPLEAQAMDASHYEERARQQVQELRDGLQNGKPAFIPNGMTIVNTAALAKAQGRFINAQTQFLMLQSQYGSKEYVDALSRYSQAQTAIITAMQAALHEADII